MLFASGVKIPTDLSPAYSDAAGKAEDSIKSSYGRLKTRQATEGSVRGQAKGSNSYGQERMATRQGLDTGALEAALGGQIGEAGYTDTKNIREYNQQKEIADLLGNAMRPDTFQQIIGGLNGAGNAAGQYAALYQSLGPKSPSTYSPYSSRLSLNPGMGASRYGLPSYEEEYDPYADSPNKASLMYRGGR